MPKNRVISLVDEDRSVREGAMGSISSMRFIAETFERTVGFLKSNFLRLIPLGRRQMKFVVVNGRRPRPDSFCALCCEPIGDSYLRDIETRLSYCDHNCYVDHRQVTVPALEYHARAS